MAKKGMTDFCVDALARFAQIFDPKAFTKNDLDIAVDNVISQIGKPKRFWDYAMEFQINSLLSGLGTPLANAASVVYKQIHNPLLDVLESLNPRSDKNFVDVISAIDQARQGFLADIAYFRSGWATGYPLDINTSIRDAARKLRISEKEAKDKLTDSIIEQRVKNAVARDPLIDEEQLRESLKNNYKPSKDEIEKFLQESYDYVRGSIPGRAGEVIRWPTKLSVAIDEYGKARFRRYKIGMMVSQKARKDATGANGKVNKKKYKELYDRYVKESMEHVSFTANGKVTWSQEAEMAKRSFGDMQRDLEKVFGADIMPYDTVKEYALREMFQQKLTGIPKSVADARNKHPVMGLYLPFLKTPWNITKEGFSYVPAVPQLMKKYLSGDPEANLPGAYYELSYDEMIARQIMGAGAFAVIMGLVEEGRMTGKPRTAQEAQTWKDANIPTSSIKIGDTWYSYERIEPLATVFGLSSEMSRTFNEVGELPEADQNWDVYQEEILKGTMYALKSNIMQKSFIEGFSDFFNDITDGTQTAADRAISGITRQFTPALMNQFARLSDPYERQATNWVEKLQQRVPIARKDLPVEYGLTGGPRETNLTQVLTSFNVQDAEQSPLQRYIYDLGVTKMREDKDLKGVNLDNEQLATLRQMSNEFITPRLEQFVARAGFQRLPDPRKKVELDKYIDKLKRVPRERFYAYLRRNDPKMAIRFRNEVLRKRGQPERMTPVD